jgi:uncharacterized protein (DUF849 family)
MSESTEVRHAASVSSFRPSVADLADQWKSAACSRLQVGHPELILTDHLDTFRAFTNRLSTESQDLKGRLEKERKEAKRLSGQLNEQQSRREQLSCVGGFHAMRA